MTEPAAVCTTIWTCVREFQTLITGTLAVGAAATTAYIVWRAANLPVAAQDRRDSAMAERRRRHECLVLSSQLRVLGRRAGQAAATIRTYIAANESMPDTTKEKIYLAGPSVISDWEVMSTLPSDVVDRCLELMQQLDDHNYDVARAGGAFGADNFRAALLGRLDVIMVSVPELANDLAAAAQPMA